MNRLDHDKHGRTKIPKRMTLSTARERVRTGNIGRGNTKTQAARRKDGSTRRERTEAKPSLQCWKRYDRLGSMSRTRSGTGSSTGASSGFATVSMKAFMQRQVPDCAHVKKEALEVRGTQLAMMLINNVQQSQRNSGSRVLWLVQRRSLPIKLTGKHYMGHMKLFLLGSLACCFFGGNFLRETVVS